MHRTLARTDLPTAILIVALTILAAVVGYVSQETLIVLPVPGGLGLAAYAGARLWHIYDSRRWPATTGRLVSGELESHEVALTRITRRTYWYPRVEYRYTSDGREYTGDRVALDLKSIWNEDREYAEILLDRLRKARLNVYVDPRRPRLAVLFYGATPERISHYWALVLGGTLISATAAITFMLLNA